MGVRDKALPSRVVEIDGAAVSECLLASHWHLHLQPRTWLNSGPELSRYPASQVLDPKLATPIHHERSV